MFSDFFIICIIDAFVVIFGLSMVKRYNDYAIGVFIGYMVALIDILIRR
jgi:hypothetical protein